MSTLVGRRVATFDDIERGGDYYLSDREGGSERDLWFLLPLHPEGESKYSRDTRGSGLHRISEPPWSFRECQDGSIEVRASIACGRREPEGEYFHGWLNEGHVWQWEDHP